jgi:transcriptional regulator with XRE-family HTH domain
MEGFKKFRESLGIGQRKMASLIGVSRSQLSLYELGLRSLPTGAMMLLGEMFMYYEHGAKESFEISDKVQLEKQEFLTHRIAEIKFQQLKLAKKIGDAQKKIESAVSQLQLAGFNPAHAKEGKSLPAPSINIITGDAAKTLNSKLSFEMYVDGLKLKMLAFELELLEGELGKS